MPLKDWLISLTANKLGMDEELCDKIINWAYNKAREATLDNAILEFSGFGKIYAKGRKVDRRVENLKLRLLNFQEEDISYMSEEGLKKRDTQIKETEEYIIYLERKQTNGIKLEAYIGGPQEQSLPSEGIEGIDSQDTGGEAGDMQDMPL